MVHSSKSPLGVQAVVVVIGDGINFGAGIILAMLLARIIPVEEMGTFRQITYLGLLVVTVAEFGIGNTVYRYWNALDNSSRHVYVKMICLMTIVVGLLSSIVLLLLANPLSNLYDNPSLKDALFITFLFPLASIPLMLLRPVLICKGNSFWATMLEAFFSTLGVLGLIIPLLFGGSFLLSLQVWVIILLLRLIAIPFILKNELFSSTKFWDNELLKKIWEYELPIQVGRVPGYFTGYFDKIFMSFALSTSQFAIYSIGAREIPFIGNIGMSIGNVLVPKMVEDFQRKNFEPIFRRWRLTCERTAVATYLIATFFIWYAVPAVQLLFSAQYTESSIPFRFFAALTFLRVVEYASLAKALGRGDLIMKSSFISAGALLLTAFPLTYQYQSAGMALAVFLGTLAAVVYFLVKYKALLSVPISVFFPWKKLLLIGLCSLISVAVVALTLAPLLSLDSDLSFLTLLWKLGVLFAFSGCVYITLLLFLGFIDIKGIIKFVFPARS